MRISTTRVAAIAALGACAALGLPTSSASATPAGIRWTADLDGPASDAVNVTRTGGLTIAGSQRVTHGPARIATVVSAPHTTARLVASVRADVDATVPSGAGIAVELRGERAGGTWTEWRDAGTALPAATATVQARVTLTATGASPVLRSLRLTATPGPQALTAAPRALAARTYRVYGTREGLVGSSTANGHVITSRDHFVALPSRRGLSPKGSSQYSVKVCNP
ncbi:MAG: hypothetical protein QOI35_821, partial [Cryptosporangiaceae bacterium]|nr:hypothetical protein [Cryptosporangiaceae bacterium]